MADRRRDIDLQRYFDGEVGTGQARKIRQQIDANEADQQQLETLGQMRGLLREATEAAADEANFDHLWTRVKAGIDEQEPLGLGERAGYWLRRYGAVMATAAAAAVLAVVLIGLPTSDRPARNDAVIESLETGPETMGTIFTIDGPEETGETTVIWVTETSAEEEM